MAERPLTPSAHETEAPAQPFESAPAGAENVRPYNDDEAKGRQVEQMFDSIAPAYDFMNTAMTFGLHRYWRRVALRRIRTAIDGRRVLDIATGTGDLPLYILRHYSPDAVCGADLSSGMLAVARRKAERLPEALRNRLTLQEADCLDLPFADESFDTITVAYGVRNFERLAQGYAEMYRVLAPGGTLCVIELAEPANPIVRALYRVYARTLIPFVGRMISGDSRAYTYLPQSIAAAPQRDAMTALMTRAGFRSATWRTLTLGVVAIYIATK